MAQATEVDDPVGAPEDNPDEIEKRTTAENETPLGSSRPSISVKSM